MAIAVYFRDDHWQSTVESGINPHMSIIRPLLRLPRRRILIGLTAAAATALVPAVSTAGAPAHHLVFRLSGPGRQDVVGAGAIKIRAVCPAEACTVVAAAKSKNPSLHTAKARAQIAAGSAETLLLPLPPKQASKLKAALESGRSPTFTVKATARGDAGTHVPLSIRVKPLDGPGA